MNIEQLEDLAMQLQPGERARLAERLLLSLEVLSLDEIEKLWVDEALRRHDEMEAGAVEQRTADQVFREARARLS